MPHIKPFCGIRPAQEYVERIITSPPDLPPDKATLSSMAANPHSFLHLVAPVPGSEFLQGSRDTLIYKQAGENLQAFLEEGVLQKEGGACLYLYSVEDAGRYSGEYAGRYSADGTPGRQTGIWAVTLFDDYLNNRIRKHEYTRRERENSIADYVRQTGIDANPVLIAYKPQEEINQIIEKYLQQAPVLSFEKGGKRHLLHRISSRSDIQTLVALFEDLPEAYLADGHHRAAALSSYGVERRKFNFKHIGKEEYNFFSSIYFSAETLEIKPFNRLVKDLNGLSVSAFLEKLSDDFRVEKSAAAPDPEPGCFGMYLAGQWYRLLPGRVRASERGKVRASDPGNRAAPDPVNRAAPDPVKQLDVTLLQERILAPLLGIADPRTNERIRFAGGIPLEALSRQVDQGAAAVLFSLYPTSIHQLMTVADAGMVMPPKSTWFEPKLDLGILTHYID